jgi:diguanylate cyclase (GGDEF)-like protein
METAKILSMELDRARSRLSTLTTEVARNTDILRRSQQRELELLTAENLEVLFRRMTQGLASSYGLERVTVVLADPEHGVRHLLIAGGTAAQDIDGLLFVDALAGLAPQYVVLQRPWLGPYSGSDHQLILPDCGALKSIAIIPLSHNGRLFGSINFGSEDKLRFTQAHAIDFFTHLGVIASFSIENVVNRMRLMRSGFTDVLTGWHNRRYLQVRLSEELARARRECRRLTCLMLDVDYFKNVNDRYGHAAGDEVLCELAQRIESQVRASDVAARYGGEEFVVLLPDTDCESGLLLGERIRQAISDGPVELKNGERIDISVSTGVASAAPERHDTDLKTLGESLLARADVALYKAKSAGRDRVMMATGEGAS